MRIRHLPETDLARASFLPTDEKRRLLRKVRFGAPPYSYKPSRNRSGDIVNVQPEMFGPAEPTSWEKIQELIKRESRSEQEANANLEVAETLYLHVKGQGWRAKRHDFFPLNVAGVKCEYWLRIVMLMDDRALVPFLDLRRSLNLGPMARRFVFSMMHERIRAADPDLADVSLGIFQFQQVGKIGRVLRIYTDEGIPLYSYDELHTMVADTYKIWREVLEERETEARKRAVGMQGDLI
ncbi:MAG: type VI toxin-antitoxin system SocB family DNA replication inhibitor toxin [Alphaproteobacteria bacterium]